MPVDLETIAQRILSVPSQGRRVVALAGPPASGKSTLADALATALNTAGARAQVVPMDGFHQDNAWLRARGLLDRKGAPETFDAAGFLALVQSLRDRRALSYPTFDRTRDATITDGGALSDTSDTVIVEGNYLLFDAPVWRALPAFWSVSIYLSVPLDVLERRLIRRWTDHGLTLEDARTRAHGNDLENARRIATQLLPADIVLDGS